MKAGLQADLVLLDHELCVGILNDALTQPCLQQPACSWLGFQCFAFVL